MFVEFVWKFRETCYKYLQNSFRSSGRVVNKSKARSVAARGGVMASVLLIV